MSASKTQINPWLVMAGLQRPPCMGPEIELELEKLNVKRTRAGYRSKDTINEEKKEILRLIREGKTNKAIYIAMVKEGHFKNGLGELMTRKTASSICSKLRMNDYQAINKVKTP